MVNRNKTAPINCMVDQKVKDTLREKAKNANCNTLTEFLEKIAKEQFIFIDTNVKTLLHAAIN
jgi:hypothetical protein